MLLFPARVLHHSQTLRHQWPDHLQPSCFPRPSERDAVDVDPQVQSIADYCRHARSQVEPVHNSATPQAQDQVVIPIVALKNA